MNFKINNILGFVDKPVIWHLGAVTGVDDLASSKGFRLYPNPFTNALSIEYVLDKTQDVKLNIKDVVGKIIHSKLIPAKSGLNQYEWIPSNQLVGGTYFVTWKVKKAYLHTKYCI
ncbi:MAG: T9SS type A sorting domain-containing protein [Saprospiraceae bacterium]|nr:T9SS type A sorting domain-containing protein [Saprospiraceae bacterium]